MDRYQVVKIDGIKQLATGQSWPCGAWLGEHALPPKMLDDCVREGAVKKYASDTRIVDATPTAVARAAESDIDLAKVLGTGKDARVLASDVDAYMREHAT